MPGSFPSIEIHSPELEKVRTLPDTKDNEPFVGFCYDAKKKDAVQAVINTYVAEGEMHFVVTFHWGHLDLLWVE